MRIANSEECGKSELDLFTVPATQVEIENSVWDNIKPHPMFTDGVITFDITGDSINYLDLSDTELYVNLMLQKKKVLTSEYENAVFNDADATKNTACAPVNNILHSMFSQIQVFINGKEVKNTNSMYSYKSYLTNLLSYGRELKQTMLESEGYFRDTPGAMDKTDGTNKGHKSRYDLFAAGQPVQLRGRLMCDIMNMNRLMLSNVNITIKLTRTEPNFYLMGKGENHKIIISDCFLRVRRVQISPSTMLQHAMALEKTTAKYPIRRTLVS
jgi:hypothetical protein